MHEVRFVASAAKEFRSLEHEIKRRIAAAIEDLQEDPCPRGVRKLRGHTRLYRIRVGSYRVIYEIEDDTQLVLVTRVRNRREAYR